MIKHILHCCIHASSLTQPISIAIHPLGFSFHSLLILSFLHSLIPSFPFLCFDQFFLSIVLPALLPIALLLIVLNVPLFSPSHLDKFSPVLFIPYIVCKYGNSIILSCISSFHTRCLLFLLRKRANYLFVKSVSVSA